MNWISVKDQLPPSEKRLAFVLERELMGTDRKFYWCATGSHYFDTGYWIPARNNDPIGKNDTVIYWLELPELPKDLVGEK